MNIHSPAGMSHLYSNVHMHVQSSKNFGLRNVEEEKLHCRISKMLRVSAVSPRKQFQMWNLTAETFSTMRFTQLKQSFEWNILANSTPYKKSCYTVPLSFSKICLKLKSDTSKKTAKYFCCKYKSS